MVLLSSSILSADFANLAKDIERVEKNGSDMLHIDVMDGVFVPNISFGIPVIKSIRNKTKLPFDVHLMIEKPERHIDSFINAGADYLTIHFESTKNPKKVLQDIKSKGIKCGLSIKPKTELSEIKELLPICDLLLIMTVEPGFGGQKIIESTVEKIRQAKKLKAENNYSYLIECDGGINEETAKTVIDAGVEIIVAGNAVFLAENIVKIIKILKDQL